MHRKVYNWSIDYVELGRREYMLFAGTHPLLLGRLNFAEINRNVEIGGESDRQDFMIACEVSLIETTHNSNVTIRHIRQLMMQQTVALDSKGSDIILEAPDVRMECAMRNGNSSNDCRF